MRRDAYRILQATETAIYLFAGFLIALGAAVLLVSTFWDGVRALLEGGYVAAAVGLLDRVLLALMLAEILYTLVRFAREGSLEAEPFLIIGIIAAVRRMLVITAESVHKVDLADPAFLAVLAELFVLALSVLAFAWAIRLVRLRA
ncbi:phosphate-starvation-inducible PsiE family protein [Thermus filiformis]|uniref:Phosphate-starvation-inducible E-like protein n=1 Tax=Thermus filiformis TaxID=276 RepID=A0A0A2XB73_THEFI|nr:phosphate-starvation-inducible PsiE family protein [Thermus filiformis]KGQ22429.1 hypothetical protein THFILI_03145 [Thermus filiformis]